MKKFLATLLSIILVATTLVGVSVMTTGCSNDSIKIAMLPKFKGENYFDAVKKGAEEAVKEYNDKGIKVQLLYDGPPQNEATNQKQVDILEGWIAQKVKVILVSPNDPTAIATTLKKAMEKGIKVITFDADAQTDARDLFVNQALGEAISEGLVKALANQLQAKGYGAAKEANIGIVSSAKTDANQQSWLGFIKTLLTKDEYKWMKIKNEATDVYYPGPSETTTADQCKTLVARMGEGADKIQGAIGLTSMAAPALGSAYSSMTAKPDATKISMTGLATPNAVKTYVKDASNPFESAILWNCMDLGYLAIQTAYQLQNGDITTASTKITAGRLADKTISDKAVILGDAFKFTSSNIDNFDY